LAKKINSAWRFYYVDKVEVSTNKLTDSTVSNASAASINSTASTDSDTLPIDDVLDGEQVLSRGYPLTLAETSLYVSLLSNNYRCSCPTTTNVVVHVDLPLIVLLFAFFLLLLFVHLVSFAPVSLFLPLLLYLPLIVPMFVLLLLLLFFWSQVTLALLLLDKVVAYLGLIPKAVVGELGAASHLCLIPKAVVEELGAAYLGLIPKAARARRRHQHHHHQHLYVMVVAHLGVEAKED
jgi:hypothetical protein